MPDPKPAAYVKLTPQRTLADLGHRNLVRPDGVVKFAAEVDRSIGHAYKYTHATDGCTETLP